MSGHPLDDLVLFVSGPSGAGKSMFVARWAETRPTPTACIDHDLVRTFIRSGYAGYEDGQPDARAARQWELAIGICADMARRYSEAGISSAISAFAPPPIGQWLSALSGLAVRVVFLVPTVDVTMDRNRGREGRARMRDHTVATNHGWFVGQAYEPSHIVIDTSELTVDQTVEVVERCLASVP